MPSSCAPVFASMAAAAKFTSREACSQRLRRKRSSGARSRRSTDAATRHRDHGSTLRTARAPRAAYVLDTQLFINAFRDPVVNEELQRFHRAFSPFEHFSVIVARSCGLACNDPRQEGVGTATSSKVFSLTPSADTWHHPEMRSQRWRDRGLESPRIEIVRQ